MNCFGLQVRCQDLGSRRAALPAARPIPSLFCSRRQHSNVITCEIYHGFVTRMLKPPGHCLLSEFDFPNEKHAHLNQIWSGIEQHASCAKLTHLA
jgi:hypothetical protein